MSDNMKMSTPSDLLIIEGNSQIASQKDERVSLTTTKRLLLREFELSDVDAFYTLESNEGVVRYQDHAPRTLEEARQLVGRAIHDSFEVPRRVFELAVECEGRLIGRIGAFFEPSATEKYPDSNPSSEGLAQEQGDGKAKVPNASLWYSFLPSFQGKGIATEAMQALIPLLKDLRGKSLMLEIECDPRNNGSWKLAERLGFERVSLSERVYESKGEWVDSLVYRKNV